MPFRGLRTLLIAMLATLVLASDVVVAAPDSFVRVLSDGDVTTYRQMFAAAASGDRDTVLSLVSKVKNKTLTSGELKNKCPPLALRETQIICSAACARASALWELAMLRETKLVRSRVCAALSKRTASSESSDRRARIPCRAASFSKRS